MNAQFTFHDHQPKALSLLDAVVEGFSREQKSIPPKFFYDARGSALFSAICQQPEYYPPAIEQAMLAELAPEIADLTGTRRIVLEPGAGDATKIRLLLDNLLPGAYLPMDISSDYLKQAATALSAAYPWLEIHASCVDFTHSMPVPATAPKGPRLIFFPGSSIGNFTPPEATTFLHMIGTTLGRDSMLLIGVDTKKPGDILHAAYNDAAGVTAQFNLNLVHRMRDEIGMDCDPDDFEHHAFYNESLGRVEMHLVSRRQQTLRVNSHRFELAAGESVHTENSYKYSPPEFIALASRAGLAVERYWLGQDELFALYLFRLA